MTYSKEIAMPLKRYTERTLFMDEEHKATGFHRFTRLYLITMLDKLNRAKCLYDEATNEEERHDADIMFADYYDWFTQQQIPITYDQTIHRWLFAGRYEEGMEPTQMI